MLLKKWDDLPHEMQCEEVRKYYDILSQYKASLLLKRLFDILVSLCMLIIFFPLFLIIALTIAMDSRGGVFFRQERVTMYGRKFRVFKFRTMVANAEKIGSQITTSNDKRITKVGKFLRSCRLDEIPQLINILLGDMSFVGTRPEVVKYVSAYTNEMKSTLLLPAGVTSLTSLYFRDEGQYIIPDDVDRSYIERLLPLKMKKNLQYIYSFNFRNDINIICKTAVFVLKYLLKKEERIIECNEEMELTLTAKNEDLLNEKNFVNY